jgi:hypothetical protein
MTPLIDFVVSMIPVSLTPWFQKHLLGFTGIFAAKENGDYLGKFALFANNLGRGWRAGQ